jgi:large subunit ribosomal protein L16
MALMPKKLKYRQSQRGRMKGNASAGNEISFGEYGLQVLERHWLKTNQIEAARKTLAHYIKRVGKIWIRLCTDKPVSSRPAETRMGGGKGAPAFYVARVKPGHIIFELGGVTKEIAMEAMRLAGSKLPVKTRFVEKY